MTSTSGAIPLAAAAATAMSTPPASGEPDLSTEPAKHTMKLDEGGLDTQVEITHDGRVNIDINEHSQKLSSMLAPVMGRQAADHDAKTPPSLHSGLPQSLTGGPDEAPPPMNVVIQIVGSRGDVQPYVALGQVLKNKYGHRVRLATHGTFKSFVEDNGLEFFNIGGDPAELMAFMVKNPGLMPGFETLRNGDVRKRRIGIYQILKGCWRSCISPAEDGSNGGSFLTSGDQFDDAASINTNIVGPSEGARPFIADVIIANPPTFAHVHIAEKLGIPLHIVFTMPWSPTQAFPHPLANISSSNADASMTNFMSYALVDMMTWQGLGDVINRFREHTLKLEPVSVMWAPGLLGRLRIPHTYSWSPALIPKPRDWASHINITGFYFLSLATSYTPDPELVAFLENGPPPVYIGFGSIVVDDPTALTRLIFEAVQKAGVRALVSKGWGGLGEDELGRPKDVYMLGNVPHDWLFKHVSAVVHHGGAGTTAAGIALGRPTVVVPFFGDQPFWGSMVARAGAGPEPIPFKQLTSDNLAAAIKEALLPTMKTQAAAMGDTIRKEAGAENGAKSFHQQLDLSKMRCTLSPNRIAVWRVRRTQDRLSALAAAVLAQEGLLNFNDVKLNRPVEWESEGGPWDPISGGTSALIGTIGSLMLGVADFPVEVVRSLTAKNPEPKAESASRTNSLPSLTRTASDSSSTKDERHRSISAVLGHISKKSDASPSRPSTPLTSGEHSVAAASTPSDEDSRQSLEGNISPVQPSSSTPLPSPVSSDNPHHGSLARVLSGHLHRHNSADRISPGKLHRSSTGSGGFLPSKAAHDAAVGAGHSVGRVVEAGLRSPIDFTMAIARGFHNAPKLYGDKTVRTPDKVTDFQSGLRTAGKEFGHGLYDGITGLVTQPYHGAKAEGVVGLVKGIGRGIGGLILKPSAAFWGVPGYTFTGIFKEIQKHFGTSTENYIIAARTAQGHEELKSCTSAERADIIARWKGMQDEIRKAQQTLAEETRETVTEFRLKRQQTFDKYKSQCKEKRHFHGSSKLAHHHSLIRHAHGPSSPKEGSQVSLPPLHHSHTFPGVPREDAAPLDYEEAIQQSVALTSQGNAEEDALIERAIRASVAELQSAQAADYEHDEAVQKAILASIAEVRKAGADGAADNNNKEANALAYHDDDAVLEESLYHSLHNFHFRGGDDTPSSREENGDKLPKHTEQKIDLVRSEGGLDTEEDKGSRQDDEQSKAVGEKQ